MKNSTIISSGKTKKCQDESEQKADELKNKKRSSNSAYVSIGVVMSEITFILFFMLFMTSTIYTGYLIIERIKLNYRVEALLTYQNKKSVDTDSKRYVINVDDSIQSSLYNRDGAIEKMSQVQLVLDEDKKYKRTILK